MADPSGGAVRIRRATPADVPLVRQLVRELWGSETIVSGGIEYNAAALPALLALMGDDVAGLATLSYADGGCEVVTLNALRRGQGVGGALLATAADTAASVGCQRLWLITTNDNIDAIRFYQRRGMRLVGVHVGAVDTARLAKPTIPTVGHYGIPIHDELEFEIQLAPASSDPQSA